MDSERFDLQNGRPKKISMRKNETFAVPKRLSGRSLQVNCAQYIKVNGRNHSERTSDKNDPRNLRAENHLL